MAFYDQIRSKYENSLPEEKLMAIKNEFFNLLAPIMGNSHLLGLLGKGDPSGLPDEYVKWCEEIYEAGERLQDLVEGLTDSQENNRTSRSEAIMARMINDSNQRWAVAQEEFPELSEFSDLSEAVLKTMDRLGLELSDEIKELIEPFPNHHFRINSEQWERGLAVEIDSKYRIVLREFINKKIRWKNYEGTVSSVADICQILIWWVSDNRSIDEIRVHYPQFALLVGD